MHISPDARNTIILMAVTAASLLICGLWETFDHDELMREIINARELPQIPSNTTGGLDLASKQPLGRRVQDSYALR